MNEVRGFALERGVRQGPAAPRALRGIRLWAHLTRRRLKSHLARGQAPCRYAEPATHASVTRL